MLRSIALALATAFLLLPAASAQDAITGKYSGRMTWEPGSGGGRKWSEMVELQIDKAEGGAISGTTTLYMPLCHEKVPVKGRIDGDTLIVVRTEKDPTGRCPVNWEFKVSGNKLEGKSRGGNATLSMSK